MRSAILRKSLTIVQKSFTLRKVCFCLTFVDIQVFVKDWYKIFFHEIFPPALSCNDLIQMMSDKSLPPRYNNLVFIKYCGNIYAHHFEKCIWSKPRSWKTVFSTAFSEKTENIKSLISNSHSRDNDVFWKFCRQMMGDSYESLASERNITNTTSIWRAS